jgi:AcrR family transcriptional regulator
MEDMLPITKARANQLPRTPKQSRAIISKDKIISAAKVILSSENPHSLSMREISRVSGVGLGTIYDYFGSKEDLLATLLDQRLKLRLSIFDDAMKNVLRQSHINEFIELYLKTMREAEFWSKYDLALNRCTSESERLKALYSEYHKQTARQYVRAFKTAGSNWANQELEAAAWYLITISTQFAFPQQPRSLNKVAYDLLKDTHTLVLKKVLNKPESKW